MFTSNLVFLPPQVHCCIHDSHSCKPGSPSRICRDCEKWLFEE